MSCQWHLNHRCHLLIVGVPHNFNTSLLLHLKNFSWLKMFETSAPARAGHYIIIIINYYYYYYYYCLSLFFLLLFILGFPYHD